MIVSKISRAPGALRPSFEHHIEWSFRCTPEPCKSAGHDDIPDAGLTRLRAEAETNFLGERCRNANHGRSRIVDAPDWVQVGCNIIVSEGLDNHPRTIRSEGVIHMP